MNRRPPQAGTPSLPQPRRAAAWILALAAGSLPAGAATPAPEERIVEVHDGVRIVVDPAGRIFLAVRPLPGDGYGNLATRYTGDGETWQEIRRWNEDAQPVLGRFYRIPLEVLRPPFRYYALRRVFPADESIPEGWAHPIGAGQYPAEAESLWRIAEWFTGSGERFRELSQVNAIPDLVLRPGDIVRIPDPLLLPPFGRAGQAAGEGPLRFERDEAGEYALYPLGPGEALYSAVAIRFTGRVESEEVNEAAARIAERSGIRDVTRIPVGHPVKIPKDLLASEYLPPGDLQRIEIELLQAEVDSVPPPARSGDLQGVYVVLDPGHGGVDVGTKYNGVQERDYVYDIMCRIKRRLERDTSATVLVTVKDEKTGFAVSDHNKLRRNGDGVILTHPPYRHTDPDLRAVAVNLRWYLANSYFRDLRRQGVGEDKILFTSIHADSLHPAVRGATFYVPGERFRRGTYGNQGAVYHRRQEVREKPFVSFPRSERIQSEGLSRKFSTRIAAAFRANDIAVHPYQPIRGHVIRKRQNWIPAVIRANEIPTKILLEVCNLRNAADNRLLTDPAFRERIAKAYVEAVIAFYRG